MKVKLTSPWQEHKPGAIIDVTPGQRNMIVVLEKGKDYPPAQAEAERPGPKPATETKTPDPAKKAK